MIRRGYPSCVLRRRGAGLDERAMKALGQALTVRDQHAVGALLAPNVVLLIDSGSLVPTGSTRVAGRRAVVSELHALMASSHTTAAMASINGVPGLTLVRDERIVAAITAERRSRLLSSVWVVCNPDKLRHWNP